MLMGDLAGGVLAAWAEKWVVFTFLAEAYHTSLVFIDADRKGTFFLFGLPLFGVLLYLFRHIYCWVCYNYKQNNPCLSTFTLLFLLFLLALNGSTQRYASSGAGLGSRLICGSGSVCRFGCCGSGLFLAFFTTCDHTGQFFEELLYIPSSLSRDFHIGQSKLI